MLGVQTLNKLKMTTKQIYHSDLNSGGDGSIKHKFVIVTF